MYEKYKGMLSVEDRGYQGEVSTPLKLVNEMLDKLPEEVFINKSTTFLDPGFGNGTFLIEIVKRLRKQGHSMENIQERVYGCEISHRLYNKVTKLFSNYNFHKLYKEDFLTKDFNNMKFDVVIGNPPYQRPNRRDKLWPFFVDICSKLLVKDGYLAFVTPDNWLKASTKKITRATNFLYPNQKVYLNLDASEYFPNVGESICSYIVQNTPTYSDTPILFEGQEHNLKLDTICELLVEPKITSLNKKITEKYTKEYRIGPNRHYDLPIKYSLQHYIDEGILSLEKTEHFDTFVYSTTRITAYANSSSINTDKWRVMINMSGYYFSENEPDRYMPVLKDVGTIGRTFSILCDSEQEAIYTKSFLSSKLYRWFVAENKQGGFNVVSVHLPILDQTRYWSDEDLYEHFGLTDEERRYVEQNYNKKK